MTILERLISNISRLPSLGKKSASRIAYFLLKADISYVRSLAADILELREKIKLCPVCGNYTEEVPCSICTGEQRDKKTICVVEESKDIISIESTRQYSGLYHVLMGAISPIDGIGPDNLRIDQLCKRVKEEGTEEVIIATNPTLEGETTALYLTDRLKVYNTRVTRIALGLPVGGNLEYADRLTLTRALEGRKAVE